MVRNAVGVVDVSTLGKIDIQGPDAGAFLDFVYTNMFSTLKVGRARYGLMLREDGHVMDDGTTARLGEHHYVMTTTTAAAGQVMAHLEFVAQGLRPDLDVRIISATEQWAQFSVAGPLARQLLNGVLDQPIDDESFPFMACGVVKLHGVDGRLFRISFSGETRLRGGRAPSRYGDGRFTAIWWRGPRRLAAGPTGMEALNVLRIGERLHHPFRDPWPCGRPNDIGMQRMLSAERKSSSARRPPRGPACLSLDPRAAGRPQSPVNPDGKLTAGASGFSNRTTPTPASTIKAMSPRSGIRRRWGT